MQVAFDHDLFLHDPENGFQRIDKITPLQPLIGIENEAVGKCFMHHATTSVARQSG